MEIKWVFSQIGDLYLLCLYLIELSLKLKLHIPASNDEKYLYLWKMYDFPKLNYLINWASILSVLFYLL